MAAVKTTKVATGVLASVKQKAAEVVSKFPGITHIWSGGSLPDHNNKRCIDYMIKTIADGNAVANYNWAHRNRLGVRLIIWNGWIIRNYDKPGIPRGTWSRYTGPNPHRDHPHVEYDSSNYVAPKSSSNTTPKKNTPKPSTPKKTRPVVDLSEVIKAAKSDSRRRQGGTTPGAADDVKVVEDALRRAGLLSGVYAKDGSFGSKTIAAYSQWQKRLGYRGKDADGIPGLTSLKELGKKYGFNVKS